MVDKTILIVGTFSINLAVVLISSFDELILKQSISSSLDVDISGNLLRATDAPVVLTADHDADVTVLTPHLAPRIRRNRLDRGKASAVERLSYRLDERGAVRALVVSNTERGDVEALLRLQASDPVD